MIEGYDIMAEMPPGEEVVEADEPWFIEPKDHSQRSEFQRQQAVIAQLHKQAPLVDVLAIPNAGRLTEYERMRRWGEGARAGALDLIITWPGGGIHFAEMKNGRGMPSPPQRARLNLLFRQGHGCGVYRSWQVLLHRLRQAGAPFIDAPIDGPKSGEQNTRLPVR